jgi:hypothetical protein
VDLDATAATGTAHSLRVAIDPATAVTDTGLDIIESIELGYDHGFTDGMQVIYSNGAGDSIGGLANQNEYYVIILNPTTIRLADSPASAQLGLFIDLDAGVAEGSDHYLGVPFRAVPIVDNQNDTIHFDGVHAFVDGTAVVYDNGGGISIGGLTDNDGLTSYYVGVVDASTIKLYTDTSLTNLVDLDASTATGFGHTLMEPDDGTGSISSGGKTTVSANSDGLIIGATLAASKTDDKKPKSKTPAEGEKKEEEKESPGGQKYGFAVSGSVSINLLNSTAIAFINDSVLTDAGDLEISADDSTEVVAASGAFAWSSNKNKSVGLAGAVTVNQIDCKTRAYIINSALSNIGGTSIWAHSSGSIIAVAAGFGGSARGVGIAGSVAYNTIDSDTAAFFNGGSTLTGSSLSITATDTTSIFAVAGAVAFGGSVGIGAGIAYNAIEGGAQAYLSDSDVDVIGAIVITATNDTEITAVSVGAALVNAKPAGKNVPPGTKVNALAAALGLSINTITSKTSAYISNSTNTITAANVLISADDNSDIIGVAGAVAAGFVSLGKAQQGGNAAAVGVSLAFNTIDHDISAYVVDATLEIDGDVDLSARSEGDIYALAISAAIAGALTNTNVSSLAFAGAGSVTLNTVRGGVRSSINRSNITTTNTGSIRLTASDESTITADAGGVALAVAITSGSASGTGAAIGAAVAFNRIENGYVRAAIEDSDIESAGSIILSATSTSIIEALTLAGAGAVGSSGSGGGYALSGAGAYSDNTITSVVEAYILDSEPTIAEPNQYILAQDSIMISATDTSVIDAQTYGFTIAVGASKGSGRGGALSVGVSLAYNTIDTDIRAFAENSKLVTTSGNVEISATGSSSIEATSVAASVAAGYSGSGNALALSGGGAESRNIIRGETNAFLVDSILESGGHVSLTATTVTPGGNSVIDATVLGVSATIALSPGGNAGGASIGVARALNYIGSSDSPFEVRAYVDNSSITAGGDITQTATAGQDIDVLVVAGSVAVSVGRSAIGLSGAGVDTQNFIFVDVKASIDGDGPSGISGNSVTLTANDTSTIDADAGAASIAVAVGLSGASGGVSIAVSLARNEIHNEVETFITGADGDGTLADFGITSTVGDISLNTTETAQIEAVSVAASVAVGAANGLGVGISGAGAEATNIILTKSNAYIKDSQISSAHDLLLSANNNSSIHATIVGVSAGAGIGGNGVGASIGVSLARNRIGWNPVSDVPFDYSSDSTLDNGLDTGERVRITTGVGAGDVFEYIGPDLIGVIDLRSANYYDPNNWTLLSLDPSPAETRAFLQNTSASAVNDLTISATASQDIDATVFAGSAAISGGGNSAGLSGAGASSFNKVSMLVLAYIDGDGADGVSASSVSLTADDTSVINVLTQAVSIAGSYGGNGVSLSIGVAVAHNEISNVVEAYISNADQGVVARTGDISLTAQERARIRSGAAAASAAASVAGSIAASLSGAGADAANIVLTKANAHIDGSLIRSAGAVTLTSNSSGPVSFDLNTLTVEQLNNPDPAALTELRAEFLANDSELDAGDISLTTLETDVAWQLIDADRVIYFITNVGGTLTVARPVILARVLTATGAISIGGTAAIGASIGASLSRNLIGFKLDGTPIPAEVRSYITGSSVHAGGALSQIANNAVTINSTVFSGSVAVGGSSSIGVGLSGAGASSVNRVATRIEATIDGSGPTGIRATRIDLDARDSSVISASAGSASLAGAFGMNAGVAVSISVGLGQNEIHNEVISAIRGAADVSTDADYTTEETSPLLFGDRVGLAADYLDENFDTGSGNSAWC